MPPSQTIDLPAPRRATAADREGLGSFEVPPHRVPSDDDGAAATPRWAGPALLLLLLATAGTYLWNLAASGYGNSFYAAAVEAGSKSWKAMFFGSLDPSNFITVDKPPASLWVMDLSARLFGFSTWSVMVPGVLEGVAAVALLYGAVRRVTSPACGLLAGAVLAATPVAALMFRFDNPDALLVLLLVGAAYCLTRAIERAGTRWLVAVGVLLGFAFLTKMLQAFTVVPAFGLAYLVAAPTPLRRRVGQLVAALGALVVASGWWVTIVALTPAADRPFIDGSPDNSIWNLIFVYNGFGRLQSSGGGANFSGTPGIFRLFNDLMGGQASWLLPAALLGLVVVLIARRRERRTDRVRAAAIVWGGWLVVTGAVFSFGQGIIHTYYTVALAPAIAALVALGAHQLWTERHHLWSRATAAAAVAVTAGWAWVLLDRTPSWNPALRWVVVVAAFGAVAGLLAAPLFRRGGRRVGVGVAIAALAALACLAGPVAYAAATVDSAHTGSLPSAGPATSQTLGAGTPGGAAPGGGSGHGSARSALPGRAGATALRSGHGPGGPGRSGPPSGSGGSSSLPSSGVAGLGGAPTGGGGQSGGGETTSRALVRALEADASAYRWVAAVDGSQSAADLELAASGDPVMAIGGFNGHGGDLSLAAFEADVARGDIHYYIAGDAGGGPGGGGSSAAITAWVKDHFRAETIGGQTVYDLSSGATRH
ncbi:MAG: ArnT family glycosyltransferase [Acidimicrobiales bacterium]